MRRAELTDPQCVVKIGSGRGFIVEQRLLVCDPLRRFVKNRRIITAGHCLPNLPIAFADSSLSDRNYDNLLGSLDEAKPNIWVECLFVDPIADIAVLGCPDCQVYCDQADAYDDFVDERPFLRIGEPRNGPGWMLSLANRWVPIRLKVHKSTYGVRLEIDATDASQSGSPILRRDGRAVGLIAIGQETTDDETGKKINQRTGGPILVRNLPMWFLNSSRIRGN